MSVIEIRNLCKNYTIVKNKNQRIKSLLFPQKETFCAVNSINMSIEKGASVGFIGPNGAGKSTTIKMLTGILQPTSGSVSVSGFSPSKQRKEYVKHIGVVFGNRSQLWWDLPVRDTFELFKEIYKIPDQVYQENMKLFSDILDLGSIAHKPVRQLSLGQRMRCEIAAAFLHNPEIVFLDEPTIGLDIVAKEKIREFISFINKERGVTVLVTSHDMADIENICEQLIVIDHGNIVYEGLMSDVADIHGRRRYIDVEFTKEATITDERLKLVSANGRKNTFEVNLENISMSEVMKVLAKDDEIEDIKISSTPIEEVIKEIYLQKNK